MLNETHTFSTKGLDLVKKTDILRALPKKQQDKVVGINADTILLKCKDDASYVEWVKAWNELTN